VHGSERNAVTYYETVRDLAACQGIDLNTIDIVSLQILTQADIASFGPDARYYEFDSAPTSTDHTNWKYGGFSNNFPNSSSFDILDHIISRLSQNRPNLDEIVIAGQSAGGRFVARWAASTTVQVRPDIAMSFWSANAGLYMWLDDEDLLAGQSYKDFPCSVEDRYGYMARPAVTNTDLRLKTFTRDIRWTVGALDTDVLPTDCGNFQGNTRRARWTNHKDHLANECAESFGASSAICQSVATRNILIQNVGHGHQCSFASGVGVNILFDTPALPQCLCTVPATAPAYCPAAGPTPSRCD
jgi:hypothetical protein